MITYRILNDRDYYKTSLARYDRQNRRLRVFRAVIYLICLGSVPAAVYLYLEGTGWSFAVAGLITPIYIICRLTRRQAQWNRFHLSETTGSVLDLTCDSTGFHSDGGGGSAAFKWTLLKAARCFDDGILLLTVHSDHIWLPHDSISVGHFADFDAEVRDRLPDYRCVGRVNTDQDAYRRPAKGPSPEDEATDTTTEPAAASPSICVYELVVDRAFHVLSTKRYRKHCGRRSNKAIAQQVGSLIVEVAFLSHLSMTFNSWWILAAIIPLNSWPLIARYRTHRKLARTPTTTATTCLRESGLHIDSESGQVDLPWSNCSAVSDFPDGLLVIYDTLAFWLPDSMCASGTATQAREVMRKHIADYRVKS